ncbi:MAG TPA: O-antigen ligase family protein [Candidatus Methanoperedens sp.]|nr:O-antigen ligase family protein [Candidatus Methanoperedens sp.]
MTDAEGSPGQAGWRVLALLILLAPLVQGGTPRLPTLAVELGILGVALHWAATWGRAPRRELRVGAVDLALGGLLFWVLFSTVAAPYYHAAEGAALLVLCFAILYWFLAFHPSYAGLATALTAVRAQAAFQSALVLVQRADPAVPRPPGTFYNPNFLASFLAAALLLALGALLFPPSAGTPRSRARARLALRLAEAGLLLVALLATGSRGGFLAFAAGLGVLLLLRSWKIAAATLAAGAAALLVVPNPLSERLRSLPAGDPFAFSRLAIWKSAGAMFLDNPWLGVGLGQYEFISHRYAFPVAGHWARYVRVAENAHSEYLQAGAELGAVGLALLLALLALLALPAARRLRDLPGEARGPVASLLAGCVSIAAHAAVDFPLHAPPTALLLVLFAAGLRVHGAAGVARPVQFRVRPLYAGAAGLAALALAATAVRPVAGFWCFLGGIGAPRALLREKWALDEAPRREPPPAESARLLGRAARIDAVNASYHRAFGSRLFQSFLRGEAGEETLREALFHLNYAAALNPNQYQYAINLAEASISLARLAPPGRERLEEALAHYRRAAALAPHQYAIQIEIGLLADRLGDATGAEAAFRRAVAIEDYALRGWYDLGTFLARHGRMDEAREAFATGAARAGRARAFRPASPAERDLIALEPAVFYNELRKIEAIQKPEGAAS